MALSSLFCPLHVTPSPFARQTTTHVCFPSTIHIPHNPHYIKKEFQLASVASVPYQPINVDYLEGEFSGHGVTFEGVGDSCVAKMELENGSTVTLMLPSGLITSYKSPMWHGEKMELLHTAVSEGENGEAIIQGGVSLNLNFQTDDGEVLWSPTNWVLHDIKGNSEETIQVCVVCLYLIYCICGLLIIQSYSLNILHILLQVELINRAPDGMAELKYIVTLREDVLLSDLEVSNSRSLPLQMTGSILSHLTVSTPDATYALGLERSNYCSKPPFESEFFLSPPEPDQEIGLGNKIWNLFRGTKSQNYNEAESSQTEDDEDFNSEETDDYKHLGAQVSLIYTNAPRNFTVIDRVRNHHSQWVIHIFIYTNLSKYYCDAIPLVNFSCGSG